MAHRNCFRRPNENITSSENTKHIKQKTIFKGAQNVAENNGRLVKRSSMGNNKGTYIGNIYTTTNGSQRLVGASSYESLLDVTSGKYLSDPLAFGITNSSNLWEGSIFTTDLSGLITIDSKITSGNNYLLYPPDKNAVTQYPDGSNNPQAGGIYVDPCYNVFYPNTLTSGSSRSTCYLRDENSYIQNFRYEPKGFKQYAYRYLGMENGYIGPFIYPASNLSLKCDKYWIDDISNNKIWSGVGVVELN